MLGRISSAELAEWQAYYQIEPFGESWKQSAYVCAMIGNSAGGKRGGKPYKPDDFLPVKQPDRTGQLPGATLRTRSRRMSGDEMAAIFRGLASGDNRKS